MSNRKNPGEAFTELVAILDRLRDPGGCPWDREQTFASLRPFLVEETAEVLEALDKEDLPHLREELGDLLLQIIFHARLGREAGAFDIIDVIEGINRKMVSRHPHVFGNATAHSAEEVLRNWEALKAAEKPAGTTKGPLGTIPPALPALQKAYETGRKAGKQGFDWPDTAGVWQKVREEMAELEAEAGTQDVGAQERREEEFGDLLFTLTNLARHLRVDPERALDRAVLKFRGRYEGMIVALEAQGRKLADLPAEQKEEAWQEAKRASGTT